MLPSTVESSYLCCLRSHAWPSESKFPFWKIDSQTAPSHSNYEPRNPNNASLDITLHSDPEWGRWCWLSSQTSSGVSKSRVQEGPNEASVLPPLSRPGLRQTLLQLLLQRHEGLPGQPSWPGPRVAEPHRWDAGCNVGQCFLFTIDDLIQWDPVSSFLLELSYWSWTTLL